MIPDNLSRCEIIREARDRSKYRAAQSGSEGDTAAREDSEHFGKQPRRAYERRGCV